MTTTTVSLAALRRDSSGKGAARSLRREGRVPAVIYGRGRDTESLAVNRSDVEKLLMGHSTSSTVIELSIDGQTLNVLIRDMQRHPVRAEIMHIDFLELHEGEKITLDVPLHLVGMPTGVRTGGGTLEQIIREIQLAVLPKNIPENIEIDVSGLEIGQTLHVSDIKVQDAEILTDPAQTVCTIAAPRVESETTGEEGEETGAAEPELIRKPKEEEAGEEEG